MQGVINFLWYFVIFSFFGWLANGLRTIITEKKFSNSGFLNSPFCPTYGICASVSYYVLRPFTANKFILYIGACVLLSFLVVIIGTVVEKLLKFKLWDFSNAKMNIGSFITLPYALTLGFIGSILVGAVIPVLNIVLNLIPFWISLIIVVSFCAVILLDYIFSIITTLRLLKRIKRLKNVSVLIKKGASPEEIQELEENYNNLFTENLLRKRLANAYPGLKHMDYVKQIGAKIEEIKEDNMKEYTQTFETDDEKPFAFGFCFTKLFYLFIIGSLLGTLFETIWALFAEGHFELRVGMVYGPFIPVYGGGACFLTAVLYKLYKLNDTLIFAISAVVGASFEYFCSWFQETLFGTVSWDYSDTPFNLDGRTNLMYALIWGFLGLVWVRYLYPWAAKLIEKMPKKIGSLITIFLILFMSFNAFMSISATYRWTQRQHGKQATSGFSIYLDKHFDDNHMKILFPHMTDVENTGVTTTGTISNKNTDNKLNKN